ncbi:MAG: PAS domain-containing protein [Magnetococcales bacterium]|nr:PAS domain-containing protein [Magnetococcales bacterium]
MNSQSLDVSTKKPQTLVGIGASSGGVNALKRLIGAIPADSGLIFVILQHLDPTRKSLMVEIASHWTSLPVEMVHDGLSPSANHVYLVPSGHLLTVVGTTFRLTQLPSFLRHPAPIDNMFLSLAENLGSACAGVVLSGTGQDGAKGLKAIRERGGIGVVQEPNSSEFGSMPQSALELAGADLLLPPEEIPLALIQQFSRQEPPSTSARPVVDSADQMLEAILERISRHRGTPLHGYKKSTLLRRVQRRMTLRNLDTLADYCTLLREETQELERLIRDLLIGVTHFFRDPEAYRILEQQIVPRLFADKEDRQPVRVWVAGCASGEEAYSVAMLLMEFRNQNNRTNPIQIFATDLDEQALDEARTGNYDETIQADVSPERLEQFFTHQSNSFRVSKALREIVVFALHNLLSDPPFSRIDLIVCRNVLIYMEPDAQKKLLSVFRFVLNQRGCLFLGSSESLGEHAESFDTLEKTWRIFIHQGKAPKKRELPLLNGNPLSRLASMISPSVPPSIGLGKLCRTILENHGPATALISQSGEVVYTTGNAQEFFIVTSGEPRYDILSLIRPNLRSSLRTVMEKAAIKRGAATLVSPPGTIDWPVRITVTPVSEPPGLHFLLVTLCREPGDSPPVAKQQGEQFLVQQLEQELQATRDDLQRTIEQLQSRNEELMAYNEEIMAMNEELQSANEELESSKEEMQSLNEELVTANAILDSKVLALEEANMDIANLFSSTDMATVFLDRTLRIKRFTLAATRLLRLIPGDLGRPLRDIANNLKGVDLLEDVLTVLTHGQPMEKEVQDQSGLWYLLRTLPYRDSQDRTAGVVILFADVTRLKQTEEENNAIAQDLRQAKLAAEALANAKGTFLAVMSHEIRTPLNLLLGLLELLNETPLNAEQQSYVHKLGESGSCLLALVNHVLDFSKAEAGALQMVQEAVALPELLRKVTRLLGVVATDKEIGLSCIIDPTVPAWVTGDRLRLHQVLVNLVGNAIKFTASGQVVLRAVVEGKEPEQLHLQVEDSGIGIDNNRLREIFSPFVQADNSICRNHGGTGLGLSITDSLVKLMGGVVWVESQLGKGSVFHVQLPLRRLAAPPQVLTTTPPLPPDTHPEQMDPLRILLVEDVEDNQWLFAAYLKKSPHHVKIANNGQEALRFIHAEPFDLVFMDIQMPVMDGYEATRQIRRWEAQSGRTPLFIIALTAQAFAEDEQLCRECGCDDYLSKPLKKRRLLETIQALIPDVAARRQTAFPVTDLSVAEE